MAELAAAMVARQEMPPEKGELGPIGPNGKAGLDGENGRNGDPGRQGDRGDRGQDGVAGADGRAGADGKDGTNGEPGLIWRGPWVRNLQYWADDAVEQDGSSYVCTLATRSKPPSGAWDLLAKRGATGPPGMSRGGGGGGGGSSLAVKDEGVVLDSAAASIDFVGAGVTATAAGHALTVTIPGGGGGIIDYVQVADPGAVGAGKLWLRLPPDAVPDSWAALEDNYENQISQPTTPNGHYYVVVVAGTTDTVEPTWPTNGSTVVDGTTEWDDAGLIGPVAVESLQLYRRNDADAAWVRVGVADVVQELVGLNAYGADGIQRAALSVAITGFEMLVQDESGLNRSTMVVGDLTQMRRHQADGTNQIVGVANNGPVLFADGADAVLNMQVNSIGWTLRAGTVDPSAGAGVVADIGSEYVRDNAGAGELWLKAGATDTDWTQLGAQAAFVDPLTATPEAIANALIAAGLMAAA